MARESFLIRADEKRWSVMSTVDTEPLARESREDTWVRDLKVEVMGSLIFGGKGRMEKRGRV